VGEEISIHVVVHDQHGHPIRDLKAEEIRVSDANQPAAVRSLRLSGDRQAGARGDDRGVNAIVLLFDALGPDAGRLVRDGALELAKGSAEADALVTVLALGTRLGVVQPFTDDHAALKQAIDIAAGPAARRGDVVTRTETEMRRAPEGQPATAGKLTPRLLLEAVAAAERAARDQRAQPAIASLLGLERTLAAIPGRKAIVYFSAGMRLSTAESALFQNLISECNRAGVTLYTVDANQTTALSQVEAMQSVSSVAATSTTPSVAPPPSRPTGMQGYAIAPRAQFGSIADAMPTGAQDALRELAASTGGSFAIATDDLRKQARRILQDESNYYELTYTSPAAPLDGQFRKIAVTIERPHLAVQACNGYLAIPEAASPLSGFEPAVRQAIQEKKAVEDAGIRVAVLEARPGDKTAAGSTTASRSNEATGEIVAEIPLSHFEAQEVSAEKVARVHFSVLAVVRDESGREVATVGEDVPWRVALETKERAMAEPFTWLRPFRVAPGKYQVELAVLDRLDGKVAMAHAAFESKPVAGPAVSEIMAVKRFEMAPPSPDPDDLLLYGNKRVIPDIGASSTGTHSDTLPVFFLLYPGAGLTDEPKLAVQVLGPGLSAKEAPMGLGAGAGKAAIPYVVNIPAKNLTGGRYTVRAIFSQGAARMERSVEFVVPGEPAVVDPAVPEPPGTVPAVSAAKVGDVVKLPDERQATVLAGARSRALAYSTSLPNFTCIETTRRSQLKSGTEEWKAQDTISEVVRYIAGKEERKLLEVNSARTDADRSSLPGAFSNGEFGNLLKAVFGDKPQATFSWTETAFLDGVRCEVFAYHVDRKHSQYLLSTKDGHFSIAVAYGGAVYVDAATFNARRVSVEAAEIPVDFPIRASRFTFDYGYMRVGDADYLLPMNGVVELQEGRKTRERNEIQFRDYHRLGSESTVEYRDH
jgi:VWFA-related protein